MVWIIGSALSVWAWYISEYSSDLLKYIDLLVLAGIFGGSTLFAWQINKKGDSEHFWRRYFSIDISLIFSVLVFVAVTNFLYSLTRALMDDGAYFDKTFSDATDVMFGAIGQLVFAVWSLWLMRKVSATSE